MRNISCIIVFFMYIIWTNKEIKDIIVIYDKMGYIQHIVDHIDNTNKIWR